jgi:hypothetical protein
MKTPPKFLSDGMPTAGQDALEAAVHLAGR